MPAKACIMLSRYHVVEGWEYEVVLPNGLPVCSGWVRGSKREARVAAEEHAREKGLTIDG